MPSFLIGTSSWFHCFFGGPIPSRDGGCLLVFAGCLKTAPSKFHADLRSIRGHDGTNIVMICWFLHFCKKSCSHFAVTKVSVWTVFVVVVVVAARFQEWNLYPKGPRIPKLTPPHSDPERFSTWLLWLLRMFWSRTETDPNNYTVLLRSASRHEAFHKTHQWLHCGRCTCVVFWWSWVCPAAPTSD